VSQPIDCSKKMRRTESLESNAPLFEEVIERFARAVRSLGLRVRMRLALDCHPGRKQLAAVSHVFRRNTRRNCLRALESPCGIERLALRAGAQIGAATRASGIGGDRSGEHVPAASASHHFVEARHARRAPFECLALGFIGSRFDAAVTGRGRLGFGARLGRPPLAI
jgi:hypothetical protein